MEIRIGTYDEISRFSSLCHKERVDLSNDGKTRYVVACINGEVVGFMGWMGIGRNIRYKSAWVHPNHRRNGIFARIFSYVEDESGGLGTTVTAFCTGMSVGELLKRGFHVVNVYKSGISFVRRDARK